MKVNILPNLKFNTLIPSFGAASKEHNGVPIKYQAEDEFLKEKQSKEDRSSISKSHLRNLTQHQADHKNDPTEHERDRLLGTKIEQARNNIAQLKENIQQAKTAEEKENLNIQLSKTEKEMALYVNELTTRHLKFALTAAHYFSFMPMDFESLVSSASIGIYKAAQRFAPSKTPDIHFISYARHWVKQQIFRDVAQDKQVRIPIQTMGLANKISKATAELEKILDRKPTTEEIARRLNISEEKVKATLLHTTFSTTSLQEQIGDEDGDNFSNIVADPNSSFHREDSMREEELVHMKGLIKTILTPRERHILEARYRLNEKGGDNKLVTLEELSVQLNLTRERIRQLEVLAIAKLRRAYRQEEAGHPSNPEEVPTPPETKTKEDKPKISLDTIINKQKFINDLTEGEPIEIKQKLIEKLESFSPNGFIKLLENSTSEKRKEVLTLTYFIGNNLNMAEASRKLGITRSATLFRNKEGLKDIKRFFIEGNNIGYSFFKETLSHDLSAFDSTKALVKRVEKTSPSELNEIMTNILLPKETMFLKEKYSMGKNIPYGCQVKTNRELAEIFNTTPEIAHLITCKGIQRLKEYFSKPTIKTTNLAKFAKDSTEPIKDDKIREKAMKTIREYSKDELFAFLEKILSKKELIAVTQRYNLDKPDSPKMPLKIKDKIVPFIEGITTRNGIDKLEDSAFEKIRKFFEEGINSNRVIFLNKLLKDVSDQNKKEEIKNKILLLSDEEFFGVLNSALKEKEVEILKKRYNLENSSTVDAKPQSRSSFFKKLANSMSGLKTQEQNAMKKLKNYLTTGLPSNIDIFAQQVAQKAQTDEDKNIIIEKISKKTIEEIQKDLQVALAPQEAVIITKYFYLDKFHPVKKDSPNIVEFAQNINVPKYTVYTSKLNSLKKLSEFYLTKPFSNIGLFANNICQKTEDETIQERIREYFKELTPKEVKKFLAQILPPQQQKVLIGRYNLNEFIEIYKHPIPMDKIAQQNNLSSVGTVCIHENHAIQKIIEHFKTTKE